jgi:hypothetical protein
MVETKLKQLRCKAVFDTDIEKVNPLFSKVKIRIAYTGSNRNNSYISKEAFEKALPTIYNCPIIGEFVETIEDWGSHGGKIEISDKGIKYIHTTKPYGVINESSEIAWEDVVEEDGTINTYLCATGYLWTGRYKELESVIKDSKSQSMEIEISDGSFQTISGKQVYAINDFVFSAFCILGSDIEPCFESANVTAYNFNKDDFKAEFGKMLNEFKQFSIQNQSSNEVDNINDSVDKGGMQVDKLELVAKYNLTVEQLNFNIDEYSIEELEEKLKNYTVSVIYESDMDSMMDEMMEEMKDSMTEEMKSMMDNMKEKMKKKIKKMMPKEGMMSLDSDHIESKFSATYRQKREALQNALDPKIEKDSDGNITYEEYMWVEDFDDKYVFVEKSIWTPDNYERKYGRFTYTFDEETITATISGEFEEMVLVWLTLEENKKLQEERSNASAEYEKLKGEYEEYKNKYSTPNEEVVRLQEFEKTTLTTERKEAEESLFEQFDEKLKGTEEYEVLKSKTSEFSLEDLEKECFVILGKKNANFSAKSSTKKDKVKIDFSKTEQTTEEYGGIIDKYVKKQ